MSVEFLFGSFNAYPEFTPPSDNFAPGFAISALKSSGLAALKAELSARSVRPRSA